MINDRLQKNFFDFVNGYRLKEVQTRLPAPEAEKLTILAVAFDSGFSSKSSFNTIFKMELPRFWWTSRYLGKENVHTFVVVSRGSPLSCATRTCSRSVGSRDLER